MAVLVLMAVAGPDFAAGCAVGQASQTLEVRKAGRITRTGIHIDQSQIVTSMGVPSNRRQGRPAEKLVIRR